MVQTTGKEEGNAAYTRDGVIVLPRQYSTFDLKKTIAHELFHVFSKHNPTLKSKLYNLIGYHHIGEIDFPTNLLEQKITNPDAVFNDYAIKLTEKSSKLEKWVVPILISKSKKYMT